MKAKQLIEVMGQGMSFREFWESPQAKEHGQFYAVTYLDKAQPVTVTLQWEPSNYKWYRKNEGWGREEYGYLGTVGENFQVISVKPL